MANFQHTYAVRRNDSLDGRPATLRPCRSATWPVALYSGLRLGNYQKTFQFAVFRRLCFEAPFYDIALRAPRLWTSEIQCTPGPEMPEGIRYVEFAASALRSFRDQLMEYGAAEIRAVNADDFAGHLPVLLCARAGFAYACYPWED